MGNLDNTLNSYFDIALLVNASTFQRWLRRVGDHDKDGEAMIEEASYMKSFEMTTNKQILSRADDMANAVMFRNGNEEYVRSQEKVLASMVLAQAMAMRREGETSYADELQFVERHIKPSFDSAWDWFFQAHGTTGKVLWPDFEHLLLSSTDVTERVIDIDSFKCDFEYVVQVCGSPSDVSQAQSASIGQGID
eukprot:TRINITY_DN2676_c0_g8_i1.p1 TRINITY_DN2676_c0_g8~~TRINITY_DN2676_c0_g8_i1.p1  ORF type:complete len:193 (+),score=25.68 TRINITY_DN2676_c0_g8_i1:634-1212(+)